MAAVSTLILRSMRLIGEKGRGATLDANEQVETLAELNTFMEGEEIKRLNIYSISEVSTTLTASTTQYTIGTNGTIAVPRPIKIVDPCWIRDSNGFDTPVAVVNRDSWASIVDKDSGWTVPTALYYNYDYTATSTATIEVYPSPSGSLTLYMTAWKPLQSFASLTTQVLLPPGYQLMIESNFAIHLAAGFTTVSPELAKMARDSMAAIKRLNAPEPIMRIEPTARVYAGSILTGP